MQRLETSQLMAAIDFIQQKLDRVRNYIIREHGVQGRLDPDHQYALRIIDSRKRELQRVLLVKTRASTDPDRMKAEAELIVRRPDVGELFRWAGYSHSYGRLGCTGCAFDYVQTGGLSGRIIKARLCSVCGHGIQHSAAADTSDEAVQVLSQFVQAVGSRDMANLFDVGASTQDVGVLPGSRLVYCCDVCGGWGVEGMD